MKTQTKVRTRYKYQRVALRELQKLGYTLCEGETLRTFKRDLCCGYFMEGKKVRLITIGITTFFINIEVLMRIKSIRLPRKDDA